MDQIVFNNNGEQRARSPNKAFKNAYLLYFKEALIKEKYEDCAYLTAEARHYGARQSEIRKVILEHVVGQNVDRPFKANHNRGRRRF